MSDKISIVIRGACGSDIPLTMHEESRRFYTENACLNSDLDVGSAPNTVRETCKTCPHAPVIEEAEEKEETETDMSEKTDQPAPAPAPEQQPTPPAVATTVAAPAAVLPVAPSVLPLDVPPPGGNVITGVPGGPPTAVADAVVKEQVEPAFQSPVTVAVQIDPAVPGAAAQQTLQAAMQQPVQPSSTPKQTDAAAQQFAAQAQHGARWPADAPNVANAPKAQVIPAGGTMVEQIPQCLDGSYQHTPAGSSGRCAHCNWQIAALAALPLNVQLHGGAQPYGHGPKTALPPHLVAEGNAERAAARAAPSLPTNVAPPSAPAAVVAADAATQAPLEAKAALEHQIGSAVEQFRELPARAAVLAPPRGTSGLPVAGALSTNVAPPGAEGTSLAKPATFIPGMNLSGLGDQSTVNLDEVFAGIPGLEGGPSTGGFSWSTLKMALTCWRMTWYAAALGLQKKGRSKALDVGSLVHACLELHYKSGGLRTFEACDAVAAAGGVEIASDARRFVYAQLTKYGAEEAATWDVRGVELQGTWFMAPEKIGSKKVYIPLTCRHDLLVALRPAGGPCTPSGQPVLGGVYVCDWKTCHALSYDLTKGYGMDGQFLMNALIYRQAEAEEHGPLAGIIVSLIAKHKRMSGDSLFRVQTTADEASVEEFYREEVRPMSIELYRRLASETTRGTQSCWPKNHSSCVTRYGVCPYFDICDVPPGSESSIIDGLYYVDKNRVKDVSVFLEPPIERRRVAGKTPDQIDDEKRKRAERKASRDVVKQRIKSALSAAMTQYEGFQSAAYLADGMDQKEVKARVVEVFSQAWPVGTKFPLALSSVEGDEVTITTNIRGINWFTKEARGSFTWRILMNDLTQDWWNPSTNTPEAAEPAEALP